MDNKTIALIAATTIATLSSAYKTRVNRKLAYRADLLDQQLTWAQCCTRADRQQMTPEQIKLSEEVIVRMIRL